MVLIPRRWDQVLRKQAMSALTVRHAAQGDGGQKARSTGESALYAVKTSRVRECRVDPVNLQFRTRVLSTFAHEAAGAPSIRHSLRPLFTRADGSHSLGAFRPAGTFSDILSVVVPRLDRGTQYSRGFSAQALLPLEYWIARSRLRQGSGAATHSPGSPKL